MRKSELEQYARENRKRLETQEVKLGDVVKVLVGQFAGEQGVIVGINAYDNDFADPYYEVNMYCEVPDKYKCRKTLLTPYNVIGGVSAYEFEVVGNRVPKQPTEEIKVGDIVKIKSNAPRKYHAGHAHAYTFLPIKVTEIESSEHVFARSVDGFMYFDMPARYLEPYYSAEDVRRMEKDLQREKEQLLREHSDKDKPHDNTITIPVKVDLDDTYWDAYKAELVKEFALKLIGANEIKCLQNANYITDFAARIVDNLKKHKV